jgi:hypothetical protein
MWRQDVKGVVVAREQLSFFTLKKLCLAHSLLIGKI